MSAFYTIFANLKSGDPLFIKKSGESLGKARCDQEHSKVC